MKHKRIKRIISIFLTICFFLASSQIEALAATEDFHDPFEAMYDSEELIQMELRTMRDQYSRLNDTTMPELSDSIEPLQRRGLEGIQEKNDDVMLEKMERELAEAEIRIREELTPDRYIVKYKAGSNQSLSSLQEISTQIEKTETLNITNESDKSRSRFGLFQEKEPRIEVMTLSERMNPKELADELRRSGMEREIEYIQPDFKMEYAGLGLSIEEVDVETNGETSGETNNPINDIEEIVNQEDNPIEEVSLDELEEALPEVENKGEQGEILVALLDTGVDSSHPALQDALVSGWNFADNTASTYDAQSPMQSAHGTHIAGIIAENGGEYVKIMPLQVFGEQGAYTSDIIAAIEYAQENDARIANMSFGSTNYNLALREAMENSSMLFVASVGNARSNLVVDPVYPAAYGLDNLISVASLNNDGGFSYFSNYSNTMIDIAALGREVNSTMPGGGYGPMTGTSMASAQVTAALARVSSYEEGISAHELKMRILYSADRLSNLQNKVIDGKRLNLSNALVGRSGRALVLDVADDFDVHGYQPTQSELFELYAASGKVVKVAAGQSHSFALKEDGTVWSFGYNNYGQCGNGTTGYSQMLVQVIGLTDVKEIAAGHEHSLALKNDGTVWVWGNNNYGQLGDGSTTYKTSPVQVSGLIGVVSVAAGDVHNLALKSDGTVWSWGHNGGGQLGDSTTETRYIPVQVTNLTDASTISAGGCHSIATNQDGTVWSWGDNGNGQLGNGSTTSRMVPGQVTGLTGVVSVAARNLHSLALKSDGTVWAWGDNEAGQLGDGDWINQTVPVKVIGLTGVVSVAAGYYFNLTIKADGTVWTWGWNGCGQLGLGDDDMGDKTEPVQITALTEIISVAAGIEHSMALKSDGTVWAWGGNHYGQLGDGGTINKTEPVQVAALTGIVSAAGSTYSLALKSDGTVWAWGNNVSGQLGDGSMINKIAPVQVTGLTGVVSVAAGGTHGVALKSDGTVWTWGGNYYGQLGDGSTTKRTVPVQVAGLTGVVSVGAGYGHSLALKSDGTLWSWGDNYYGQLGDGSRINSNIPVQVTRLAGVVSIAAGSYHNLALKSDGALWSWGENRYGQLGDGSATNRNIPVQVTGLTGVVSVTAGLRYNLALKTDGTVWAWGENYSGQLGDGTYVIRTTPVQVNNLVGITSITAGGSHSLALKSDGTVWAWGNNNWGQLGDGNATRRNVPAQVSGLAGTISVVAGDSYSIAVKRDGTIWIWGYNNYGQLGLPYSLDYHTAPIQSQTHIPTIVFDNDKYESEIPKSGNVSIIVSAKVLDQNEAVIPNAFITYMLSSPYAGVSIESTTGIVSITSQAQAGSVGITAVSGTHTKSVDLILTKDNSQVQPVSLAFEQSSYTGQIPMTGSSLFPIKAYAIDIGGERISEAQITYSQQPYTGVMINNETGEVSIGSDAPAGQVLITATCDALTASVTLTLEEGNSTEQTSIELAATLGKEYLISTMGSGITTFTGREITVTYDAALFEVIDLCAITYAKNLTSGQITHTEITITQFSPGVIKFKLDKTVPPGKTWSGVMNMIRLKAKATGGGIIQIF